jgi:hypothetical protein
MAPMDREVALRKLQALAAGAELARKKLGARAQQRISAVGWGSARLKGKTSKKTKRRGKPA